MLADIFLTLFSILLITRNILYTLFFTFDNYNLSSKV